MTRSTWRSGRGMEHQSEITMESQTTAGVRFTVARMSFGRRLELTRRVGELAARTEYNNAGQNGAERLEAALLEGEIDRIYLEWGLVKVEGLAIDGEPATAERIVSRGPEKLCREIVAAIKAECGLNEEERKNS
jgi:hypothetical protein